MLLLVTGQGVELFPEFSQTLSFLRLQEQVSFLFVYLFVCLFHWLQSLGPCFREPCVKISSLGGWVCRWWVKNETSVLLLLTQLSCTEDTMVELEENKGVWASMASPGKWWTFPVCCNVRSLPEQWILKSGKLFRSNITCVKTSLWTAIWWSSPLFTFSSMVIWLSFCINLWNDVILKNKHTNKQKTL